MAIFIHSCDIKSESGNEARCGEKGRKGCTRGEGHFLIMYQVRVCEHCITSYQSSVVTAQVPCAQNNSFLLLFWGVLMNLIFASRCTSMQMRCSVTASEQHPRTYNTMTYTTTLLHEMTVTKIPSYTLLGIQWSQLFLTFSFTLNNVSVLWHSPRQACQARVLQVAPASSLVSRLALQERVCGYICTIRKTKHLGPVVSV